MHRKALNGYFIATALLFVALFAFVSFYYPKGVPELWINQNTHHYADKFFLYATEAGHGLFFAGVVVLLLFVHVGYSAAIAFAGLLCAIISQALKRMIYADSPRPPKFFEGVDLYFVEGSEVLYHHSFPSGHTTAAFAVFFLLAHLFTRRKWGFPLALMAAAVALSRVYLLKHFFVDVFTGACLGLLIGMFVYYVIFPTAESWNYKLTHRGLQRLAT